MKPDRKDPMGALTRASLAANWSPRLPHEEIKKSVSQHFEQANTHELAANVIANGGPLALTLTRNAIYLEICWFASFLNTCAGIT